LTFEEGKNEIGYEEIYGNIITLWWAVLYDR